MDNQIKGLDSYLRNSFKLSKNFTTGYYDEWINIFSNLTFQNVCKNGQPGKELEAYFTEIDWESTEIGKKEGIIDKHAFVISPTLNSVDYPFNEELLMKIIKLKELTVGNAEMGEKIPINHIEPIKYLSNLNELCICDNAVASLKPIWNHPNLKRVWIGNTLIPLAERELFRRDHPNCKLEDYIRL